MMEPAPPSPDQFLSTPRPNVQFPTHFFCFWILCHLFVHGASPSGRMFSPVASWQKEIGKRGSKGHPWKCTLELNFPFSSYSLYPLILIFCHLRNDYTCHHSTRQNFWYSRSEVGSGSLQFDADGLEATLQEPPLLKKYAWDSGWNRPHLFHQSGCNASFGHYFSQKRIYGIWLCWKMWRRWI